MHSVCSHWVMNDLSVSAARAKWASVDGGYRLGPFIMHHLAQSLKGCHLGNPERIRLEENLPGLTTPTAGAFALLHFT